MTGANEVTAARGKTSRFPLGTWERSLLLLLLFLTVGLIAGVPGFYPGFAGFLALSENFLPFGLVALGLTTVILTGGIDLSVGATAGLSAIVMAELWSGLHISIWLAALVGVIAGGLLGLVNGLIITRLRTEPLIATLATSFIYGSIATALAGDTPPSGFPDSFNRLGTGAFGDIVPFQILLFAVAALLFSLLISRSIFGRKIIMIGYNVEAARYSGIRVDRIVTSAYVISGVMAGLAGIVLAAYYSAVRPDMGDLLLLSTITIVVLGGVSIFGGDGTISGVVIAVLLLGVLRQGMLIAGFSDMVTTMLTGAILLAAIAIKNVFAGRGGFLPMLLARFRPGTVSSN
ncbi:ABC transporter permease [Lichenicola cladoniae]|uniref:Autoinducer 2 import system permease protein LsrD n=1 Tax=Lichenicola cladoniae TaxID=1484109 RepID=A0A6M8H6K2_9PROT|nr:ABC transporter permease [Lichenicola cladoniae]NPD69184.1 ABC transporter permease [Acetobacteraceae bacterium]QKE89011.1 ABC transporter permease [Lichenicola cladoniae]